MRPAVRLVAAFGAALVINGIASCSGGDGSGGFNGEGGAGGGHGSGADTSSGGGLHVGGHDGASCNGACSTDLRNVLDADGDVVRTCATDEACACGACTRDVCKAAEEARSSYGCDYFAMNLDNLVGDFDGGCYAAFVANTWSAPAKIHVDRDGHALSDSSFIRIPHGKGASITYDAYDPNVGLPPGEVAILFLSEGKPKWPMNCPVKAAVQADTALHGSGKKPAFHLATDAPVVAYQIYPYGGGRAAVTSATLLLPTSAWDDNYVAINTFPSSGYSNGRPTLDIVAAEDGTIVTLDPVVDLAGGGGLEPAKKRHPTTFTLDRGQYAQFTQAEELTGSAILANKPIGVFGGNTALDVPTPAAPADTGQQQTPPVRALGNEYVAVRYRERHFDAFPAVPHEIAPYRLVGAVDGTTLTYSPATPKGAPTKLDRGEVAEFWTSTTEPFVVASQDHEHPFSLVAYMTSGGLFYQDDPATAQSIMFDFRGEGDPEAVNVVPPDEFLDRYVFFTDPTYPETNLVVVRTKGKDGKFADVTLDCLGTLSGWSALGDYEWTRVDLQTGNFADVGDCSNGRHVMESKVAFGLTVWGWGSSATGGENPEDAGYSSFVSYAYPAGMSVRPVNKVRVIPTPK